MVVVVCLGEEGVGWRCGKLLKDTQGMVEYEKGKWATFFGSVGIAPLEGGLGGQGTNHSASLLGPGGESQSVVLPERAVR